MQLKQGSPAATAAAPKNECEDESLLYLLDCLMMLYSAAVHRVLREVNFMAVVFHTSSSLFSSNAVRPLLFLINSLLH